MEKPRPSSIAPPGFPGRPRHPRRRGRDGIRSKSLAKRLHVTKGSFYWHFKDRQDLLAGVLDVWKDGRIRDIIKADPARPAARRRPRSST